MRNAISLADHDTVLAAAEIPADPDRIFRALTTRENERWWGAPDVYTIVNWTGDLRVGGKWSLGVRLPDGLILPASGEFLRIESPRLLVQTRRYDFDHPTLGRDVTTVTYTLDPLVTAGTRLTVRHEGFNGRKAAADEHAHGWERLLNWLAEYFENSSRVLKS